MIRKIKIVDVARNNPDQLFALGRDKGEFYFLHVPEDPGEKEVYDGFYSRVKAGEDIFVEADIEGRNAWLIVEPTIEERIEEQEGPSVESIDDVTGILRNSDPATPAIAQQIIKTPDLRFSSTDDDIYREHDVSLRYKNNPHRAILIEPWNSAGDLFDITRVLKGIGDFTEYPLIPEIKALVDSWKWDLFVDSREVFYESVESESTCNEIRERKIRQVCECALSYSVDLILLGLFSNDNASHMGSMDEFCSLRKDGLEIVNRLRESGYKGNIVALKVEPYVIADTGFNREGLRSLYDNGVIISPSAKLPALRNILGGGKFLSDYRLDGTPDEIEAYRIERGLGPFSPLRPI